MISANDDSLHHSNISGRSNLELVGRSLDPPDASEKEMEGFSDGPLCRLPCVVCPLCRGEIGGLECMVDLYVRGRRCYWPIHHSVKKEN